MAADGLCGGEVGGGWLYLAIVIATRRLVGWSITTRRRTSLVIDALNATVAAHGDRAEGVTFHSDRDTQHGSGDFADACSRRWLPPK